MNDALTEVEAAYAAGFKRWAHFRLACRAKLFPEPVRVLPGTGPVWTRQQIDAWLGVAAPSAPTVDEAEREVLRRVEEAALRRKTGVR